MGYTTCRATGFTSFEPDNDESTLYLSCEGGASYSLDDIINNIASHFGEEANLEDFDIEAEHIHTKYIYYDLYEPVDWTNFIVVRRVANHKT